MSLIAWRKWQAGLRGQGDAKDLQAAIEHVQGQKSDSDQGDFLGDEMIVNKLTVRRRLKVPVGTDMYD